MILTFGFAFACIAIQGRMREREREREREEFNDEVWSRFVKRTDVKRLPAWSLSLSSEGSCCIVLAFRGVFLGW